MKHICPICEKETTVRKANREEVYNIRGEEIIIPEEFFVCSECEEEFDDPKSNNNPVEEAYREYRKRKSMTQPDDIKALRKKFNLTQKELSSLLGWGGATLSRYENGALQDDSHERMMKLIIRDPSNLITLFDQSPDVIAPIKKKKLLSRIASYQNEPLTMIECFRSICSEYTPDIQSGFKSLDIEKLLNCILYFCKGGTLKTKINKLLFYADFKFFKENSNSITGLRYTKFQYGPVPENYHYFFAFLINDEQAINVEEIQYPNCTGEIYHTVKGPDLTLFSESELKIMNQIKEHFAPFNATQISDFSHKEKGYIETPDRTHISYDYANVLSL